jgi:hypothetical protein
MRGTTVATLALLLVLCSLAAHASDKPTLWIEAGTASNTPAGCGGWMIYSDGRMVWNQQTGVEMIKHRERHLSKAQMKMLDDLIDGTHFFDLPNGIGNGGRGEPTAAYLTVTRHGRSYHVESFDGGDRSDASKRFNTLYRKIMTLGGDADSSAPLR